MKTAIVLGATGLVGKNLIRQLAGESSFEKVISVTRRPIKYTYEKVLNEVISFDHMNEAGNIFKGDVLFSCLGTTKKQAGSLQNQRIVDFDFQYQAAKISAQNGVAHYVLVSSSGANKNSSSPYLKMKGELEDEVMTLPFKKISILQPSLLVGERKEVRFGEAFASWVLPILCKLPPLKRYRPISGDAVARKMVSIGLSQRSSREIYALDEIFI